MRATRLVLVVLLTAGAVIALAIAAPWNERPTATVGPEPSRSASAEPSESSGTPTPVPSQRPVLQTSSFVGPGFDPNLVSDPTEPSNQARLWYNDGSWWGLLVSSTSGRFTIHELNWESQRWVDTGVLVDDRPFARLDALWDGRALTVASSGIRNSASHALQVARFGYDAEARRYRLQPDFPQHIASVGVLAPTLTAADDGRVWLAYVRDRATWVAHTDADGVVWGQPFELPDPPDPDEAELATIVAADGETAVVWTGLNTDTLHVARHRDGQPDDAWTFADTTIEGLRYGDDEMSVAVAEDASILVLLRTSLDQVESRNNDAAQLVLARLDGTNWTQAVVSRVRDGHAGPVLLVDDRAGDVYVVAEAENAIQFKRAAIDQLVFDPGVGTLLIPPSEPAPGPSATADPSASADPSPSAEPIVPAMGAPTSSKGSLLPDGQFVVLAADIAGRRYGHAVITIPGTEPPPAAQGHLGPLPEGVQEGLAPGQRTFVFRTSFNRYPDGPGSVAGWSTRDEPADQLVTIVQVTDGDRALRLTTDALRDGTRACRPIAPTTSGLVVVEATVQVRGVLESDAVVTALRGDGTEVASMRLGEPGTIRYFVGDERITSEVPFRTGAWYRSVVTLDVSSQSYGWQIAPLGSDTPILSVTDLPLRAPAPVVDEVCVQAPDDLAASPTVLLVDDVAVSIGPGE